MNKLDQINGIFYGNRFYFCDTEPDVGYFARQAAASGFRCVAPLGSLIIIQGSLPQATSRATVRL